jgi:hypothetical protein
MNGSLLGLNAPRHENATSFAQESGGAPEPRSGARQLAFRLAPIPGAPTRACRRHNPRLILESQLHPHRVLPSLWLRGSSAHLERDRFKPKHNQHW